MRFPTSSSWFATLCWAANFDTKSIIQIDADNVFNSINRKVLLHNIQFFCTDIITYVYYCYAVPVRLFVTGGVEILSEEGTMQGDPKQLYAISVIPLSKRLILLKKEKDKIVKQVAFADNITGAAKLVALKIWWDLILNGSYLGYYINPKKSYLRVKPEKLEEASNIFADPLKINVTSEGRKHLGAFIGNSQMRILIAW